MILWRTYLTFRRQSVIQNKDGGFPEEIQNGKWLLCVLNTGAGTGGSAAPCSTSPGSQSCWFPCFPFTASNSTSSTPFPLHFSALLPLRLHAPWWLLCRISSLKSLCLALNSPPFSSTKASSPSHCLTLRASRTGVSLSRFILQISSYFPIFSTALVVINGNLFCITTDSHCSRESVNKWITTLLSQAARSAHGRTGQMLNWEEFHRNFQSNSWRKLDRPHSPQESAEIQWCLPL